VSQPFTDIDGEALQALITWVSKAKEDNLAYNPEDYQLLLDALLTLANIKSRLTNHAVTAHKCSFTNTLHGCIFIAIEIFKSY